MTNRLAAAWLGAVATVATVAIGASANAPLPDRLSETGLYSAGSLTVDPRNRPFSPQYPLWSDGARKSRWVRLPEGTRIDATDVDAWELPVGTRFWKEFEFAGRKVETRVMWRSSEAGWTFATYVWNEAQTDATRVPDTGLADAFEVSPGRRHSIPSVEDCRACHEDGRSPVLGFTALQLSTDRDPNAPHAEPLEPAMVTLRTLAGEDRFTPPRPEFAVRPPRIPGDAATRAALGYLSANCGTCHSERSSLATVRHPLKMGAYVTEEQVNRAVRELLERTTKWDIPHAAPGTSRMLAAGAPDRSALLVRMRSRRPSSQMPPLGSVLQDADAVELLTTWIGRMR